ELHRPTRFYGEADTSRGGSIHKYTSICKYYPYSFYSLLYMVNNSMNPGGISCSLAQLVVEMPMAGRRTKWASELAGSTVFGAPVLFLTLLLQCWDRHRQEGRTFLLI